MGMSLIYVIFLLCMFLFLGIIIFIISLKKKSIIGIVISALIITPIILALFSNTIDELNISKKDVISDLSHLDINLIDDFKIIENTVMGMPERIQETKVEISKNDKNRIIEIISNSTNFKSFENERELTADTATEQFNTSDKIFNFKYPQFYSREAYKNIDKFPTRIFLTIYGESSKIKYQKIED